MATRKILAYSTCLLLITIYTTIYFNNNDKIEEITQAELVNIQNLANSFPTYLWYMGSSEKYDFFHASHNKTTDLGYAGTYKVKSSFINITTRFEFTEDISRWSQYHPSSN